MTLKVEMTRPPQDVQYPPADLRRRRTLERLYMRKSNLDELIRALEVYQQYDGPVPKALHGAFSVARKCSSSSVQSRI